MTKLLLQLSYLYQVFPSGRYINGADVPPLSLRADAVRLGSDEYQENEDKLDWKTAAAKGGGDDRSSSSSQDDESETPDSKSVGFSESESESPDDSQSPEDEEGIG